MPRARAARARRAAPLSRAAFSAHARARISHIASEPIKQRLVVFVARLGLGDQLLRVEPLERGRDEDVGPDGAAQPEGVLPREVCAAEEGVLLDVPRALAQVAVPTRDVLLQQLAWLGLRAAGYGSGVGVGGRTGVGVRSRGGDVLVQPPTDEVGRVGVHVLRVAHPALEHLAVGGEVVLRLEGRGAVEHLVEEHAERPVVHLRGEGWG